MEMRISWKKVVNVNGSWWKGKGGKWKKFVNVKVNGDFGGE